MASFGLNQIKVAFFPDRRGVAAVEFALVLPLLLLLLLGIVQFGVLFAVQSAMESAAESGARAASIEATQVDPDEFEGSKIEYVEDQVRDAVTGSLAPWWGAFFVEGGEDAYEEHVEFGCTYRDGTAAPGWSVTIWVEASAVGLGDPVGVFSSGERMETGTTWPSKNPSCS